MWENTRCLAWLELLQNRLGHGVVGQLGGAACGDDLLEQVLTSVNLILGEGWGMAR